MEERGLLTPRRDERGWRVYTKADIELARTHLRQRPLPSNTE
jgi:DNA-binding transcriptional MerR regulator